MLPKRSMRMKSALPIVVLFTFAVVACKKDAVPGSGGSGSALVSAAPPTIPQDWQMHSHDVGFSLALPQGWDAKPINKEVIGEFASKQNENAWDILGERKADVDLDTAKGLAGLRSYFSVGDAFETKSAEQTLVALREVVPGVDLEEAAKRWKDTLFGGSSPPPLKEATVELPVGRAMTLSMTSTTLGFIDKTTVYFLVDGDVQYTFFFVEQAKDADPIPVRQIMETFRPAK
jgi:hypothetical protein